MAIHAFAAGTSLATFDLARDTLAFTNISAAQVVLAPSGSTLWIHAPDGAMVLQGVTFQNLGSANFSFADESVLLFAHAGGRSLVGGATDDQLLAVDGKGADTLSGGAGDDVLVGGRNSDWIDGGDGNDVLRGSGAASLDPTARDTLLGGAGDDTLYGEEGTNGNWGDVLSDSAVMTGGAGADRFVVGAALSDSASAPYTFATSHQYSNVAAPSRITDFNAAEGDRIRSGITDGHVGDTPLVWRGAVGDAFAAGGGAADFTGAIGQAVGGRDLEGRAHQMWMFEDAATGRTVLYMDRNGDFLVDENDFRLEFDGAPLLDAAAFTAGTFTGNAVIGTQVDDVLLGTPGADHVFARAGDDLVQAGGKADTVDGGEGNDTLWGGLGADTLQGDGGQDELHGDDGLDVLNGGAGDDTLDGGAGGDVLESGDSGYDPVTFERLTGSNVLLGGADNDTLLGGNGNDLLDGGEGTDSLRGGDGADTLLGGEGNDVLDNTFGWGGDWLDGGAGDDKILARSGDRVVYDPFDRLVSGGGATLVLDAWYEVDLSNAVDQVAGGGKEYRFAGVDFSRLDGSFQFAGTEGDNLLIGAAGADTFEGLAGNDTLVGDAGDDDLLGGAGNDTLVGGAGDDELLGGAGNDSLDGGIGADTQAGGAGNDVYLVDDLSDWLIEVAGEGRDQVQSAVDYVLGEHFEDLQLSGAAQLGRGNASANLLQGQDVANLLEGGEGSDTLQGLEGDDTLDGGAGADMLQGGEGADSLLGGDGDDLMQGGAGADTMAGGAGSDRYEVDDSSDVAIEQGEAGGLDTVVASVDHTLADGVENLELTGSARAGHGNGLANSIAGSFGGDHLEGGAGNDTIVGGAGDDLLEGGAGNDVLDGAGLVFGGGADTLQGGAGDDELHGWASGGQTLEGGEGDDRYFASIDDVIHEAAGGGYDTVHATGSFILPDHVESLILVDGSGAATGNALDNRIEVVGSTGSALQGLAGADTLVGGDGADLLSGGTGRDAMAGGLGSDTYIVDNRGDTIVEAANGGVDMVFATTSVVLADHAEMLFLQGLGNLRGSGNAGNNSIVGNEGDNTLRGGDGNDFLDGASGADLLAGGSGNDTLVGGAGDDVLSAGAGADTLTFASASGQDTVTGFKVAQGDLIHLAANLNGSSIVDAASALAAVSQAGADAVIDLGGGNAVTLVGVDVASLGEAQFVVG